MFYSIVLIPSAAEEAVAVQAHPSEFLPFGSVSPLLHLLRQFFLRPVHSPLQECASCHHVILRVQFFTRPCRHYTHPRRNVFLVPPLPHSPDRLFLLRYFATRWQGCFLSPSLTRSPLVATIHLPHNRLDAARKLVPSLALPPRFTVILHAVKRKERYFNDFPVNLLRNICIRHITTSHFMVLDIDMWPTASMHRHLVAMLPTALAEDTHAVVVPPVFLNSKKMARQCFKLSKCFELCRHGGSVRRRSRAQAPRSVSDLKKCVDEKLCLLVKEGGFAHVRVRVTLNE